MKRKQIILLAILLGLLAGMIGCAHHVTPVPHQPGSLHGDAVSVYQANERLHAEKAPSDNVKAAVILLAPVPKDLEAAQKYIDALYIHDQAMTNRVDEVNNWYIGPKGWRYIYWITGLSVLGLVIYEAASFYGFGGGGLLLRGLAWLTKLRKK